MSLKSVAFLTSRIFDYYFWATIALIIAFMKIGPTSIPLSTLVPVFAFLDIGLPVGIYWYLIRAKEISDIDVTKRKERYPLFAAVTVVLLLATIVAYFESNQLFFILQLTAFLIVLTTLLITFVYKISGHIILNCAFIFIINYFYDWKLLWLFLVVPLVAWARVYLKKHTLAQVLAGAIVGLAEPYLILKIFNLI